MRKKEFLEINRKIRKPMPPPSKVIVVKKYDRKDKTWEQEINE